MGRLFTVKIEDLGGEQGRSEATSVMPRSNSYHGICRTLASRIPEMGTRLREAIHYLFLMMGWRSSLVQNSRNGMGEVLSSRPRLLRTHPCLLRGQRRAG